MLYVVQQSMLQTFKEGSMHGRMFLLLCPYIAAVESVLFSLTTSDNNR